MRILLLVLAIILGAANVSDARAQPPTPIINFNPTTATVQHTSSPGTLLSQILVTMTDGSTFTGSLAFGSPNSNDGGRCAISGRNLNVGATALPAGISFSTITPASGGSLVNQYGTWTFSTVTNQFGNGILLNGSPAGAGAGQGFATLLLSYNNQTYAFTSGSWFQWNGTGWPVLSTGDPRPMETCSITAATSLASVTKNFSFIVTVSPTPVITLTPATISLGDESPAGTLLTNIGVTMSDGSSFAGGVLDLTHGPYNNGAGLCVITGSAITLGAQISGPPSTITNTSGGSLSNQYGTWTFSTVTNQFGNGVLLNGAPAPAGAGQAFSTLLLSFNNQTYAFTTGTWFQWNGSAWPTIQGDPRPAVDGVKNCTLAATKSGQVATSNFSFTALPQPIIAFTPVTPSVADDTPLATVFDTVSATMSDGSAFTGSFAFGGTYGNGGGVCSLSGSTLSLGIPLPHAPFTENCSIVATQAAATPTITFNPISPIVGDDTPLATALTQITVKMSDGSNFTGSLSFGPPNNNDGGRCALSGSSVTLGSPFPAGTSTQPCTIVATQAPPPPPPVGVACDVGPTYTGTIPAGAIAAFGSSPRCLMNLDFTSPTFASTSNWLDCFGAGSPLMWKHSSEGSNSVPCDSTHFAMVTDGGVQVFRMQFPAADIAAGITQVEIDSSTNGFGSAQSVSGTTIPLSNYTEFVSRVGAINTYSSSGGNTTRQLLWAPFYYQPSNSNNDTFLEEDWGEMSDGVSGSPNPTALNSAGGWWNCGGNIGVCFGVGATPTPTQAPQLTYNTYGFLATGDGSSATAFCNYFGAGVVTGLQHSNWISCQPGNWNNPGMGGSFVRNHMLLPLGYGHTQGSGTVALATTQSVFIQRVTVWVCPGGGQPAGGATVGNQCNVSPVLSTSPPL